MKVLLLMVIALTILGTEFIYADSISSATSLTPKDNSMTTSNSVNFNITYDKISYILKPYVVIDGKLTNIESVNALTTSQLNYYPTIIKNGDKYKFYYNLSKLLTLTETGFAYTDFNNTKTSLYKKVGDMYMFINFQDLIDSGYNVTIGKGLVKITNLKSGVNNLDPSVTYAPSNCYSDSQELRFWTTPENAGVSDNSYATATTTQNMPTDYLICVGYGFNIPANANITQISASIERKVSKSDAADYGVYLTKDGTNSIGSNSKTSSPYTTVDTIEVHYGGNGLWGTTWNYTDVNNANFGVMFSAKGITGTSTERTISVDLINVTINYDLLFIATPYNCTNSYLDIGNFTKKSFGYGLPYVVICSNSVGGLVLKPI